MLDEKIKKIITETVNQTISRLKKSKLIKDTRKSAFKKTVEVLENYNLFKKTIENDSDNSPVTKELVERIDNALKTIESDPYYSIIEMWFFEKKSRADIASFFDVEEKTITRNKQRLIDELKLVLFTDETIEEEYSVKINSN